MKYKFTLDGQSSVQTDILDQEVNHKYFTLDKGGILTVNSGYSWDGMTLYPDDETTYYASLYHDCLYQILQLNLIPYKYKGSADTLLYKTLIRDGHPMIKAILVYIAVSILGDWFIKRK